MDARPYTFSYAELKNATGDFSPSNKLGEGGFGPVYKVGHYPIELIFFFMIIIMITNMVFFSFSFFFICNNFIFVRGHFLMEELLL